MMRHILVVANETLVGAHITRRLHELHQSEPSDVVVVVPAKGAAFDESIVQANDNLEHGLEAIKQLGIEATGRIGHADPMAAIAYALEKQPAINLILLSTLPVGRSKWIGMDLVHRVQRRFDIAIEHIEGTPTDTKPEAHVESLPVKVLVVEDNPDDLELAKVALEGLDTEVQVLASGTGAGAVHFLREAASRPDLILLDLKMPVMDGFSMLEEIATTLGIDALNELNVVVLSSSNAQSDRERAHALGAKAYVVKQPDFDEFQHTLGSLVNEIVAQQVPRH